MWVSWCWGFERKVRLVVLGELSDLAISHPIVVLCIAKRVWKIVLKGNTFSTNLTS